MMAGRGGRDQLKQFLGALLIVNAVHIAKEYKLIETSSQSRIRVVPIECGPAGQSCTRVPQKCIKGMYL